MRTSFTDAQRANPDIAVSEQVLRKCVHCGFCTATCPTYVLLGDELDSPRGRIYLIKDMLENERPATSRIVPHIDRCLSCLSCMTTCPSGVDYRRLIDYGRMHVERTYRRGWMDRSLRALLAWSMPYPARFGLLLSLARLVRPLGRLLPARLGAMLALVPNERRPEPASRNNDVQGTRPATSASATATASAGEAEYDGTVADETHRIRRVAVLSGCVQSVIGKNINTATVDLLGRCGIETVSIEGCCGSIVHHLGREAQSTALARDLLGRLGDEIDNGRIDAVVSNASGCGAQIKDFEYVLRADAEIRGRAAEVAGMTVDVTELIAKVGLPPVRADAATGMRIAYHAACSMQHGQRLRDPPRALLKQAGFDVVEIGEGHLCCGSAGTYNMLQPQLAAQLGRRKLDQIRATGASIVAAGNLGCLTQLAARSDAADGALSFVHTVELLDWATGGRSPGP